MNLISKLFIITFLSVAYFNDGFMGTDEYWTAMVKYLPAQTSSYKTLVDPTDVKSPLQVLPMHIGAQVALKMGIHHPYDQYRFSILFLTMLNIFIYLLATNLLIRNKIWSIEGNNIDPQQWNQTNAIVFLFLMTFHFASAFTLTRPMFEALGAPWILLSFALYATYQNQKKSMYIILATVAVSIGFITRQQTGIGALTIPILLLINKDYKAFWLSTITGLICFIGAGIPDYFLRGEFHYSLKAVTLYNLEHGHEYGNSSVLFYPALIVGLTLMPFFITKFNISQFHKKISLSLKFPILFCFLFLSLHTYFPQKFERFIISIWPLIIVILTPYLSYLWINRKNYRIRIPVLLIINLVLFLIATLQPSQKNIINMALFIDQNPSISKIYNLEKTIEWIPEKFIINNKNYNLIDYTLTHIKDLDIKECHSILVINRSLFDDNLELFQDYKIINEFKVNFIESLAYKFNKKNNIRRAPILVLKSIRNSC